MLRRIKPMTHTISKKKLEEKLKELEKYSMLRGPIGIEFEVQFFAVKTVLDCLEEMPEKEDSSDDCNGCACHFSQPNCCSDCTDEKHQPDSRIEEIREWVEERDTIGTALHRDAINRFKILLSHIDSLQSQNKVMRDALEKIANKSWMPDRVEQEARQALDSVKALSEKEHAPQERWQPELSEQYWYLEEELNVFDEYWANDEYDRALYEAGNCFRTKSEAEEMAEKTRALWKS